MEFEDTATQRALRKAVAERFPVVVIEAMKMEHAIRAPEGGVVTEVVVSVGQAVDTGAQLARVEPAEERAAGAPGAGQAQQRGPA